MKLLTDLARKIGITVRYLTDDEKEDIGIVMSHPKEKIVKSIKSGLKESKDIISGKKKGNTIQRLIQED